MELDKVRNQLDYYDNIIQNMLTLRLSVIPIVADIKKRNNLSIVHKDREKAMYSKMEKIALENGISANLLCDVYKNVISEAIKLEYIFLDDGYKKFTLKDKDMNDALKSMEKIDTVICNDLSKEVQKLKDIAKSYNITLYDLALIYHKNILDEKEK